MLWRKEVPKFKQSRAIAASSGFGANVKTDARPQPIRMGLHGEVKNFYNGESPEDLTTSLDCSYPGNCLTGTLGAALDTRSIGTGPDDLSAQVEGYIEKVENKPLITLFTLSIV